MNWQESFTITSVSFSDADQLIRQCEYPAMLNDPLRLLMFPSPNPIISEEEISWRIHRLEKSLRNSQLIFRKICKSDGIGVGFAGWTVDKGLHRDGETSLDDNKVRLVAGKPEKATDNPVRLPGGLDVHAWAAVSDQIAKEKQRVLQSLGMVWRKSVLNLRTRPDL